MVVACVLPFFALRQLYRERNKVDLLADQLPLLQKWLLVSQDGWRVLHVRLKWVLC